MKKISTKINLRSVNYAIVIHEIKTTKMSKNIKKNDQTADKNQRQFIFENEYKQREMTNEKKQLKKYASMIVRVIDAKQTNKLITKKFVIKQI